MNKLFSAALLFALIVFAPFAGAQDKKPAPTTADDMTKMIMSSCPQMVSKILSGQEIQPIIREHPIGPSNICACTETQFRADKRLADQFNVGLLTLNERMKSENLRAYFTVRLMSAVFACVGSELDKVLTDSDPSK